MKMASGLKINFVRYMRKLHSWDHKKNPLNNWNIKTKTSDNIDLTLKPFYTRSDSTNLLALKSQTVQCFGDFTGIVKSENEVIEINSLLGWAEEHHARW
jgi:hypothetical protein